MFAGKLLPMHAIKRAPCFFSLSSQMILLPLFNSFFHAKLPEGIFKWAENAGFPNKVAGRAQAKMVMNW